MAKGAIGSVIDTLEFETTACIGSHIIHVSGNIFAIFYDGVGSDGFVVTVDITSAGVIGNAVVDSFEFDISACVEPRAIKVSGTTYAVVYRSAANTFKIATLTISNAGAITASVIDTLTISSTAASPRPRIISVGGDYFAIVYSDSDGDGKCITIDIDSSGNIGAAVVDTLEFDISSGGTADIVNISGTMYAVVYTGPDNDGWVCTFNISVVGVIDNAVTATLEFEATLGTSCNIVNVSGDYYAISYRGPDNDGFVKTLTINSGGAIGAVVSTLEFDAANGKYPSMIKVDSTVFAVAYERDEGGGVFKGVLRSFTISSVGVISAIIDTLEYETSRGLLPSLLLVPDSSGTVAVTYQGVDGDGFVKTALITTTSTGEGAGVIAVVEERLHYVDAYGVERFIQGTAV